MQKNTKRIVAVAASLALVSGVGVAYAAWTANGTGTGEAASRAGQDLVVTPALTTDTLYPTGTSDVGVNIDNPNEYAVHVSSLTLTSTGITASNEDCNVSTVTYTTQDNGGDGWTIAGGDDVTLDLADAVAMSNDANDDCQSNTFTVNLQATGLSAPAAS